MSDETWAIQYSWKGVDSGGREVMINVRADDAGDFAALRKIVNADVTALKPLPVKTYGGGGGKGDKKPIVFLPDAPHCPTHADQPMNIREWAKPETGEKLYFWTCTHRGPEGYCKAKAQGYPTPAQVAEWKKLNGVVDEAATQVPASNGNSASKPQGTSAKPAATAAPSIDWPTDAATFAAWQKANGVTGQVIHEVAGSVPGYFKEHPGSTYADLAKLIVKTVKAAQ